MSNEKLQTPQPSYPATPYVQQQQPQATPMMQPTGPGLGGNRNSLNKPFNQDGKREWSNGLCSFTEECGTCCFAHWCSCMVYNQNKSRREHLERSGAPHPSGGETCGGDAWLMFCLSYWCFGAGTCLQISNRVTTRERYTVGGSWCMDCLTSCFCHSCALTQEARELELEEQSLTQHKH